MKCSSIQLTNRKDYKRKIVQTSQQNDYVFITKSNRCCKRVKSEPNLAVTNLNLPENVCSFNTGASLEKWSKKQPRLKSSKTSRNNNYNKNNDDLYCAEYDITFDVDDLLNNLDNNNEKVEDDQDNISTSNMEYELHTDIEELLRKSQQDPLEDHNKTQKKKRKSSKKLKKTIKFSLSKPASPETEQIIRVDVTSSVSMEELEHMRVYKNYVNEADCSKGHAKIINDRVDLQRNCKRSGVIRYDEDGGEEEDFIIRCKQLALTQKDEK